MPWKRKWQATSVFLPGEFHGQRSPMGYSAWGHRESDTTEQLTPSHFHFSPFFTQEGHLSVSLSSLLVYTLNIPITPLFHLDCYNSHLALHRLTQCSASFPFSSVQFSRSVMSDSLRPHESQHARPPCPSPTPRVYPSSYALSR